jgi:phosphatidylinositol glycan class P protein
MRAFAGWIASGGVFALWLTWAWVPEGAWQAVVAPYAPSRYWALAGPAWGTVAFACTSLLYVAANLMATAPLDSLDTISLDLFDVSGGPTGAAGDPSAKGRRFVPAMRDVDIVTASRRMYMPRHVTDGWRSQVELPAT